MTGRLWMPLYIADYLKKTTHLGALESGAYLHLIMDYWQNGFLPNDDKQLARIARMTDREWKKAKEVIKPFFQDGWKHERVDEEIAHAAELAQSNSLKARGAANKRWSKHKAPVPDAMLQASVEQCSGDAPTHAPECTLHTSQIKDDAPSGAKQFAFESGRIRLNAKNFSQWKGAFVNLDLEAELLSLSPWAETQGNNWFCAVSGALAKRNREVGIRKSAAQSGVRLTPSGVPWPEGIN